MTDAKDASLHKRIRADISDKILSGRWPPGYRIPFEHELMAEYGCSRMTVNKALSPLAESGLIQRRRGAGSFVSRPRLHSAVLDIPDIQAEIARRGEPYGYELLSRRIRAASGRDSAEVALAAGGRLLALRCLHRANGRPFALEERLISLQSAPGAEQADFSVMSPGGWLLTYVAWTEAEHRISAANVPRAIARILGIAPTAACLALDRRTWLDEEQITQVRLVFPGEAYDLVARFGPSHLAGGSALGAEA